MTQTDLATVTRRIVEQTQQAEAESAIVDAEVSFSVTLPEKAQQMITGTARAWRSLGASLVQLRTAHVTVTLDRVGATVTVMLAGAATGAVEQQVLSALLAATSRLAHAGAATAVAAS